MTSVQILEALNILAAYPDLQEYIKTLDNLNGFINIKEIEPKRKNLTKRLDNLLDPHGMYTGASWNLLLCKVQSVLNGVITHEYIIEQIAEEKQKRDELDWEEHYEFIKRRQEMMRVSSKY